MTSLRGRTLKVFHMVGYEPMDQSYDEGWMDISFAYEVVQVTVLSVEIALILVGNILVLATLISRPRLLHPMNAYIMSMNLSGILTGVLIPFNGYFSRAFFPPLPNDHCLSKAIISVFFFAAVFNSVLCMVFIAAERYRSIVMLRGARSSLSNGNRWCITAAMWLAAFLYQIPILFSDGNLGEYSVDNSPRLQDQNTNYTYCIPKGVVPRIHHTLSVFFVYVIPVMVMGFLYQRIIETVLANIRQYTTTYSNRFVSPTPHSQNSKLRAVKAMSLVVIIFGTCWLPGHALLLTTAWGMTNIRVQKTFLYGHDIALHCAYAHNWLHVVVYPLYSHQFRAACKQVLVSLYDLLLFRPCANRKKGRIQASNTVSTIHNAIWQTPR